MSTLDTARTGRQLVAEELRRRGVVVREVRRGRRYELAVIPADRELTLRVRVSTRRQGDWQVSLPELERGPRVDDRRLWVFVDLTLDPAKFFVARESEVLRDMRREHESYLAENDGIRARTPDSEHHKITTDRARRLDGGWSLLDQAVG